MKQRITEWVSAQCGTAGDPGCKRNGKPIMSIRLGNPCRNCGRELTWLGNRPDMASHPMIASIDRGTDLGVDEDDPIA